MHYKIGDATYTPAALDRISLRNLIRLEAETVKLGRPMRWGELRALADRVSALPDEEVESSDDFPWFLGMAAEVGRVRRQGAGALAAEMQVHLRQLAMPHAEVAVRVGDDDPGDEVAPARPHKARPDSGRAAVRRPADHKAKKKASARPSSAA